MCESDLKPSLNPSWCFSFLSSIGFVLNSGADKKGYWWAHVHLLQSKREFSTWFWFFRHLLVNCLIGLVVKASASGAEDPGVESHLQQDFSGSSHTSDLKIGTPVATLPGVWHNRVSAGTGRPDVSILWLGEVESLICNFCLSVAAGKIVCADPSLR